jgi:DUF1365 family protein
VSYTSCGPRSSRPTSIWTSCRRCSTARGSGRRRAFAAATTSATRQAARRRGPRLVAARTGSAPAGPVRLLTNLRYFGHCFNPVSFYYCFDEPGERVEAVVAEVTNTPWGERHAYVLEPDPERPIGGS